MCASISYELGAQELIVRRGIITKATDVVPYHMITNVALRRGPVARALGLGTLRVHTAGYSASSNAEATVSGMASYEELRQAIIQHLYTAPRQPRTQPWARKANCWPRWWMVRGLRAGKRDGNTWPAAAWGNGPL